MGLSIDKVRRLLWADLIGRAYSAGPSLAGPLSAGSLGRHRCVQDVIDQELQRHAHEYGAGGGGASVAQLEARRIVRRERGVRDQGPTPGTSLTPRCWERPEYRKI